eukprot:TRINITY_DN6804_c0_g1_i1.p1 TRINITY_DN6804_c0_g1~~TRINITY_DN6804_c0_g1_i1.p1  ORF type:complete len:297 (-),score=91.52 TRINITY_DN6804_c0_g1_i1:261-1151(-)
MMSPAAQVLLFELCLISASTGGFVPVVLMHGITASNSSLDHVKSLLESTFPGIYVRSLEVGNGSEDSILMPMNEQAQTICDEIRSDSQLAGGPINAIGFSQGGLVMRGYLERCNDPPVKNFISWVSPQGGQFGCPSINVIPVLNISCAHLFDCCAYSVQDELSFASYWINPFKYQDYVDRSVYLADLDNLRPTKNATYKSNVLKLDNFVMSYSHVDTILNPPLTGWFGFYNPGQAKSIQNLEDTDMYQQDWIGLRTLAESGRLHRFSTQCQHGDYDSSCFDSFFVPNVIPFLNVTR